MVATSGLGLKGDAWVVRELASRLPSLVPLPRLGPALAASERPMVLGPDLRNVALLGTEGAFARASPRSASWAAELGILLPTLSLASSLSVSAEGQGWVAPDHEDVTGVFLSGT